MLGWGFYIVGFLACLGLGAYCIKIGHYGVALALLPLSAWFAARLLVESGMVTFNWLSQGQMAKWNGRFYEFEGRQFRPVELEIGLAFHESDLLAFLGLKDPAIVALYGPAERITDPESGEKLLTRAGCERLLMKSTHPESKKLLLWLNREVFGPAEKRRARA